MSYCRYISDRLLNRFNAQSGIDVKVRVAKKRLLSKLKRTLLFDIYTLMESSRERRKEARRVRIIYIAPFLEVFRMIVQQFRN
jgi:hypothetical protein